MCMPDDFLTESSTRITAEIQGSIIRQGKRNPISQRYHAKDDKEAITTWRLNLSRVRHVFNVRSVISAWPLLTVCLQTELEMNTRTTVPGAHRDSVKKKTIATEEGGNSKNQAVRLRLPSCDWCSSLSRLTPGQQPRLRPNPLFKICIQCTRRIEASTAAEKHAWNCLGYSSRRRFRGSGHGL